MVLHVNTAKKIQSSVYSGGTCDNLQSGWVGVRLVQRPDRWSRCVWGERGGERGRERSGKEVRKRSEGMSSMHIAQECELVQIPQLYPICLLATGHTTTTAHSRIYLP